MNEMTTRGTNPSSISPPVQIPQPRHVSTISSGTPPPNQQLYPGQSLILYSIPAGLVQGPAFNFIQPQFPQAEQLLPYQAYGSAPNDLRGTSASSGRGGAGPNMAQSGTYYQPNQNMRPSQPPPPNQQFYLSHQAGQGAMRHPRPTHPSSNQPIMLFQPNNNMVISPNMYQQTPRLQMYAQGAPQFPQRYPQSSGMMYFNGVQRSQVPMQPQGPPPAPREKRFINISDPNTGRNITDEIIKSSQKEDKDQDETSANDKGVEIRKNFTRQVVERMKTGESPAAAAPSQPSGEAVNPGSTQQQPVNAPTQNQPSQDHPQMVSYPPPPPPQATPPLAGGPGGGPMVRPAAMRMSNPGINLNLSVPPPQLPPGVVYSNSRHHAPPSQQSMPHPPNQVPPVQPHLMHPKGPPPPSAPMVDAVSSMPRSVESATTHHDNNKVTAPVDRKAPPTAQAEPFIPPNDIPVPEQSAVKPPNPATVSAMQTQRSKVSPPPPQDVSTVPMPVHPSADVTPSPAPPTVSTAAVPVVTPQPSPAPQAPSVPQPLLSSSSTATPATGPDSSNPVVEPPQKVVEAVVVESTPEIPKQAAAVTESAAPSNSPPTATDVENGSGGKDDCPTGASTQGNKDGRKGKKNKKDFSRKESGTEMDAFIENSNNTMNNDSSRLAATENTVHDLDETETITVKPVPNGETVSTKPVANGDISTNPQVESKNKQKKKKKKKGKKSTTVSSKAKLEEADQVEKNSVPATEPKVCQSSSDASPVESNSNSSEGKDSGVDTEPGLTDQQRSLAESKSQDKTASPSVSDEQSVTKIDESPVLPNPSVAVEPPVEKSPTPVKEVKTDKYIAEKETEVVKTQNGDLPPQNNGIKTDEQPPTVPSDNSSVVQSVPEEVQQDVTSDSALPLSEEVNNEDEENEPPGMDELEPEPSKAEMFANLKKSGGKIMYDRAYLMELRECASSQTKPDGLPELDIILDSPNPFLFRTTGGPVDFTPSFFQTQGNQRHAPAIGKSSSRGRQRPGDAPVTPRIIKSMSMSNDTKLLHQSENPWKPTKKEDKDEQKKLEGDILFIMNRLTPTNFDKLAVEMKSLPVKTYDDLQFMVNVFFDKVTMETKFVEAYALLCKVMSTLRVSPPADGSVKENMATFRVVMLTKCQHEFESDKSVVFEAPEERRKKLEAENPEKTPERDEKIERTLYQMKLRRMKFYGNIRFIGELFKLGMLTENIMHDCIYRLLKARDDDSLVSLCNLLTTVGAHLDTEKAKPRMEQYFSQMTKIADERKSRIKFTLRDVIELRESKWVPRKEATGPKKIDEVHKDFKDEQARNQYLASQPLPPRNDSAQAGSRRGSRQRQDDPNNDGWNTVSSKNVRMIDTSKMKTISKSIVDDNIQLGPGGGAHKSMWSRGSHGGTQPSQDDRPTMGSNRFSALTSGDDRRMFTRSPSRGEGGSSNRNLRPGQTAGHGRGKMMARSSQEGERRDAIANTRSFMGGGRSQNSSRDNSWNRDDRRQMMGPRSSYERDNPMTRSDSGMRTNEFRAPAPPPAIKQMSDEEIEMKAVNILDEYLNIRDLAEAKLCVKELTGQNLIHLFVSASINNVLEKREDARHMTGSLFHELVSSNIITADVYVKGLNEVLQNASDMVVDIPTLWNCLGHVIVPLLVRGSLQWSRLSQAFKPYLDNKDGAKLMAAILSQSVEKQSEKEVAQQWKNSGLSWSTYLKPDELDSFVKDRKLDFTLGGSSGPDLQMDLEKKIKAGASPKDLITFIEKTVPGNKTDSSFIRGLTTAVVNSSMDNGNVNEDVILNYKDVLKHYISNKVDVQLQALYAIQTLMNKLEHPSGALSKLFELFYYEISIEEEAFYRWERCSDPQEQESKGTCLLQVRQFFVWLRENEEPES